VAAGDIRATARGGEACQGELTNKQANKPIFFQESLHCNLDTTAFKARDQGGIMWPSNSVFIFLFGYHL
jgi:hypothetical protein